MICKILWISLLIKNLSIYTRWVIYLLGRTNKMSNLYIRNWIRFLSTANEFKNWVNWKPEYFLALFRTTIQCWCLHQMKILSCTIHFNTLTSYLISRGSMILLLNPGSSQGLVTQCRFYIIDWVLLEGHLKSYSKTMVK